MSEGNEARREDPSAPEGSAGADPARGGSPGAAPGADPSEQELRRRLDEELRGLRVQDLMLQSVVSLINLSARRIAKEDERDLEQGRIGIEAVRALVDLLEEEPAQQVRNALSEVQMLYARESGAAPGAEPPPPERGRGSEAPGGGEQRPGQRPSGLWTPPGT